MIALFKSWASLLAPGGKILFQYENEKEHIDLIHGPSTIDDSLSCRLPNHRNIQECEDQLEQIASKIEDLELEWVSDAHKRYKMMPDRFIEAAVGK